MTPKISLLKKSIIIIIGILLSISAKAKTYYFSSSSGNDSYNSAQAQNQATPWKSIAKLNSFFGSIVAGDNIYFKRGDTFYGCIVFTKSGTSGNSITIGAYGTGAKPLITGLITLSSWSSVGNGVYQSAAPAVKNTVNLVTLNGAPQAVGRYPNIDAANGGYLTYESTSNSYSITDNQLSSGTNWTGAEVVIRKRHYAMDKGKITSHSGTTINFAMTASINPLNNSNPSPEKGTNGYGYFIQRDARTLDKLGEWYFNTSTKKMQMYFGGSAPASYTVRVSTLDTLINIGNKNYININNIAFEGANIAAIYAAIAGNITVQSCDMNAMGGKGILIFDSPNVLIDGVATNNVLCGAIDVMSRYKDNVTVRNCTISNTGMIPGMGSFWDDNDYKAISVSVNSGALVEYNSVVNTGYVGIQFQGNNIGVKNNFINYFDIVKDDGGGIYTYQGGTDAAPGKTYTGRVISNNIILNGIGTLYGVGSSGIDVDGIMLDGRAGYIDISDNTIANMGENAIYSNNAKNVNIRGNTAFNNGCAIAISRYAWGSITNLAVKKNTLYPKYSNQKNFQYVDLGLNKPAAISIQTAMQRIGNIDSNYYATPNAAGFGYYYATVEGGAWSFPSPLSFAGWKSFTNHDKATKLPPKTLDMQNIDDQLRLEYNATKAVKNVALGASYLGADGTVYDGSVTLQPYTSKILIKNGPATNPTPPPPSQLPTASATAPPISSFGGSTTVSVTATGGTAPYTGTGSYTVNAGTGSLKISVANPVSDASTFIYSTIGAVSNSKTYVLRFSTLGTTANGSLKAYLRQTGSPYSTISTVQSKSFGTARINHEFIFTKPATQSAASFLIEIAQSSGTTYIDNIAFFEATASGSLISNNLFSKGQFEGSISGVSTWSANSNHIASLDGSSKITNTYYYPVKDATGAISTATAVISQPNGQSSSSLTTSATAPPISSFGGSTTVSVTATGGTAPYTGTGSFTVNAGTGSLKISVSNPVSGAGTYIYSTIGAVSNSKTYVLRFSTLGTTSNGSLKAYLRRTASPYSTISTVQSKSFGTGRIDHEFIFTAPSTQSAASFLIDVAQSSGTTYIDNIAFFEATSSGSLISNNLFSKGQFEGSISGVTTWSGNSNHVASLDGSSKITNTYYYPVKDATGAISTATAVISQPNGQPASLTASATAPAIGSFGGSTTVSVTATGGTAPYTGTGSYTVNAGTGSLKISVANPVSGASTYIYSTIGAVSNSKIYVLRFSTLGTTANGSLKVYLRQTGSPYSTISTVQSSSFGTSRIDHRFIFGGPSTQSAASFLIEVAQSSGTTYIDNIAFFEAAASGGLISNNLFSKGQFEGSISGVTTWSANSNHVASLDGSSKITNTYYYPVKDATGAISTATAVISQPNSSSSRVADPANVNLTSNQSFIANAAIEATPLKISSYPNPTTTQFNLTVAGGTMENVDISVLSMDGRLVFKAKGTSNKKYTFGNDFMPGMYVIKVMQGNITQTLKVIKIN